jgi:hypothetical protein
MITESGKDKNPVNPVSMTASIAILGESIRPIATLMIASQLLLTTPKIIQIALGCDCHNGKLIGVRSELPRVERRVHVHKVDRLLPLVYQLTQRLRFRCCNYSTVVDCACANVWSYESKTSTLPSLKWSSAAAKVVRIESHCYRKASSNHCKFTFNKFASSISKIRLVPRKVSIAERLFEKLFLLRITPRDPPVLSP